jgi:imidazolonepropionase-like amidohydrolase
VKVIADFPLLEDGAPTGPALATYAMETIAHLVTSVHAAGGRVATHSTTDTVTDLVRVGVDSVEHGTGMDEATLGLMAGTGAAWTPTLCAVLSLADDAPHERRRQVAERRERFRELLPLAHRLGVPIMTGTDVVGTIAREVLLLAELGLEPVDALAAATTVAHRFLGDKGDEHQGRRPASLVTYDADPREDLAVLAAPSAVLVNGVRIL